MKGKGGKFQKKVSNRFLVKHGKMVDEKNQPTGKPVSFVYPTPAEMQAALDQLKLPAPVIEAPSEV